MTDAEAIIKGLQEGLAETRQDVKELQGAMVGSVDGSRKGFAQQLLAVMKEMDGFVNRMAVGESRISTIESKVIKYEGTFIGARTAIVVLWAVISFGVGIVTMMVFKK